MSISQKKDKDALPKIAVIGAGPAGLTAAYELLTRGAGEVVVFEESRDIGGISKTVKYKGNRMDMGGHRFFSKVSEVNEWWERMLPMQGAGAMDDIILDRHIPLSEGGPDPEKNDRVMLTRHRVSRIFFMDRFFDYPISLKPETIRNLGFINTVKVGLSYLASVFHKLPETNLENFYINRFGRKLYSMFFEYYTENLWGRHPSEIDASWGSQRVKGLSVSAVLADIFSKIFHKKDRKVETSLIEEFAYPKYGPGQLWETTASEIERMGGRIIKEACVKKLRIAKDGLIDEILYEKDGREEAVKCDIVISSMPLKDLVAGINDVPKDIARIAAGLPYRDYMTVGVLVKRLKLRNHLNGIPNLYCVGRNGQHRYNNMDHSMCTSFEAVKCIINKTSDRSGIWNVNTEQEYHEGSGKQ